MRFKLPLMSALLAVATAATAQTKWDLPSGYPATNFHTENLMQFAADVEKATAGRLKITVHANASLFKAPEIKRAVQGGQAQMGEILLSNYSNEWPLFGADGIPFLADSYDAAMKLYKAQRPLMEKKLGEQGMLLLYAAASRGWAVSKAKNTEYLDLLKKNGMTIVAPSAQLKADMKKVGDTMLQEWLQKAGPEGQAMVDAYKKP